MNRQVCPMCALDDYLVIFQSEEDPQTIELRCEGPDCARYTWTPTVQTRNVSIRTGIAESYGVFDDLLACIGPEEPWLEYGIVEYRYARLRPALYLDEFIPRWGHTSIAPTQYTVSSFLGGALGALWRSGDIDNVYGPATGRWSYNTQISYVTRPRSPQTDVRVTWADFAQKNRIDPDAWPMPARR